MAILELLLLSFITLQIADSILTYLILKDGGIEYNKILVKLFSYTGVTQGLFLVKTLAISASAWLYYKELDILLIASNAGYLFVVLHNIQQYFIRK